MHELYNLYQSAKYKKKLSKFKTKDRKNWIKIGQSLHFIKPVYIIINQIKGK